MSSSEPTNDDIQLAVDRAETQEIRDEIATEGSYRIDSWSPPSNIPRPNNPDLEVLDFFPLSRGVNPMPYKYDQDTFENGNVFLVRAKRDTVLYRFNDGGYKGEAKTFYSSNKPAKNLVVFRKKAGLSPQYNDMEYFSVFFVPKDTVFFEGINAKHDTAYNAKKGGPISYPSLVGGGRQAVLDLETAKKLHKLSCRMIEISNNATRLQKPIKDMSQEEWDRLIDHDWPQAMRNAISNADSQTRQMYQVATNSVIAQNDQLRKQIYQDAVSKLFTSKGDAIMKAHCFSDKVEVPSDEYNATLPYNIRAALAAGPNSGLVAKKVNWQRFFNGDVHTPLGTFSCGSKINHPYTQVMYNGRGICVGG